MVPLIISLIIAIPFGIGIALLLMGFLLNKSNNRGDYKADIMDISRTGIKGNRHEDYVDSTSEPYECHHPVILAADKNHRIPIDKQRRVR